MRRARAVPLRKRRRYKTDGTAVNRNARKCRSVLITAETSRPKAEKSVLLFHPRFAFEQGVDGSMRGQVLEEHAVYLFGNRHLDFQARRELMQFARGGDAF